MCAGIGIGETGSQSQQRRAILPELLLLVRGPKVRFLTVFCQAQVLREDTRDRRNAPSGLLVNRHELSIQPPREDLRLKVRRSMGRYDSVKFKVSKGLS